MIMSDVENVRVSDGSEFEFFKHQIIAYLPQNATEIEKFLEYKRKCFF